MIPCFVSAALADDEGNNALHFAAKTGHSSLINILLRKSTNQQEVTEVVQEGIILKSKVLYANSRA